ncbi:Zn(2)-C6 fungal-type transcriptional factor [Mycena venus]|uniref:Zn(2)-C6 fungal-type transcriptional factor n=1 Tax=Mycena venus TaxID=2733690 RepID=A0A8H7CK15_9AGAR|nr:Zn(2)-C6 fungal-type transcriptional factor [Mycena venus]
MQSSGAADNSLAAHALMPVSREGVKKRKKPPACDTCKARRVLCMPTTDGTPCPRCVERGDKCTTTPVARGRPSKPNLKTVPTDIPGPQSASEASNHNGLASASNSIPARRLELPPELVHHLFECFVHLPQHHHPMYRGTVLQTALSSVSWQILRLPPQLKVLAHCVIALSASISVDYAIIGPGPKPASLSDHSVFSRGADLRGYGVRRAPMYRALCAEAVRLAFEVGIIFEPSEDNAVSCFILQFIENEKETRSRPWGIAYLSHVRAICELDEGTSDTAIFPGSLEVSGDATIWTGYLLMEVLETTQRRQPILVSHHDQLLITGGEPLFLPDLTRLIQTAVQERKESQELLFLIMQPYLFHVISLARQLYEKIIGDFPRRHPLNEGIITEFISSLTHLHSIWSLIFNHDEEPNPINPGSDTSFFAPSPQKRDTQLNIRSCAYIMTCSLATLALALHRELVRRAAISLSLPPPGGVTVGDQFAAERLTLLRRQAREMASITVTDVARGLRSMPSLPHITHIQHNAVVAWAEFCLDEADAAGGALPERAATMESISGALKLVGYSWPLPLGLIERLDAYVDTHRQMIPAFPEDSMFVDMFPEPVNNDWMSMFTMPFGVAGEPFARG